MSRQLSVPNEPWLQIAKGVEGWLTESEGQTLYWLARQCSGRGAIVEIGSWKGRSTIWLAKGSEAGPRVPVYAIDPHTGVTAEASNGTLPTLAAFRENIRRAHCDHLVVPLVMSSAEAAARFHKPVELIFIDGSHHEDMVQMDFDLWFPKLVEGGVIALHDTIVWPGPKRVARRMVYRSAHCRAVKFVHSLTFAQKASQIRLGTRMASECVLCAKGIYE